MGKDKVQKSVMSLHTVSIIIVIIGNHRLIKKKKIPEIIHSTLAPILQFLNFSKNDTCLSYSFFIFFLMT